MSRYLFVDSQADAWHKIQIKAVDATCYQFRLQQALAIFAGALGKESEQRVWSRKSDATRNTIRTRLWDAKEGIFKDAHPQTGVLSPYKAAVGFYPLMYDIGQPHHLAAMRAHLENPQTFGTPFPAPASSADDPFFDAEAEWKGKRTNCPWNGRVWPMTNSHISAAFAHSARLYNSQAREAAANFTLHYIKMLFHEGDPKLPNCYEHYNPHTGTPSLYRGIDDYQHSWIVDIILQQVAGILPETGFKGKLIVDPLPFPIASFRVEGVFLRGHWLDVVWSEGEGLTVYVDGVEREHRAQRERMEIELEAVTG
jgi:glycogen debranching enzyme